MKAKTKTRVALFDMGPENPSTLKRWVIEDPDGGDHTVGIFGELLADCYVPPVMPEFWEEELAARTA